MMELKVYCDCGQKYKFDVEPVNGQMPFTVACPICHRDGTGKANAMLQQMSVFKPIDAAPVPIGVSAPPPYVPPPVAPPPAPAPATPGRLRINVAAHAPAPTSASPPPPPISTPAAGRPVLPPTTGRPRAAMAVPVAEKPSSFGKGVLGAFVGALIGSLLYYAIFRATGVRIGLALLVGGLAGWGANILGKGEGSTELAGLAVVFTLVGIMAAQYFVVLHVWHDAIHAVEDFGYTDNLKESQAVVKAIPTGSDAEIRMYLARQMMDEGGVAKPQAITADDVKEFREKELPEYQDLASGKETKEQYMAKNGLDPAKFKKLDETQDSTFKGVFLLLTLNLRSIISMVIGAVLAYRLSANA